MERRPWQEWLTTWEFARYFPGGQPDLDSFWDRVEHAGNPDYAMSAELADLRLAAVRRESV